MRVIGTTFSGHPTRTTLGNTLRVIFYHLFALYKTGVPFDSLLNLNPIFGLAVSGDDSAGSLQDSYLNKFKLEMAKIYANKDVGAYGLG
jgi:hypothetical protein